MYLDICPQRPMMRLAQTAIYPALVSLVVAGSGRTGSTRMDPEHGGRLATVVERGTSRRGLLGWLLGGALAAGGRVPWARPGWCQLLDLPG